MNRCCVGILTKFNFERNWRNLTFIDFVNRINANLLHIDVAYHTVIKFLACNVVIGPEMRCQWALQKSVSFPWHLITSDQHVPAYVTLFASHHRCFGADLPDSFNNAWVCAFWPPKEDENSQSCSGTTCKSGGGILRWVAKGTKSMKRPSHNCRVSWSGL